MDQKMEPAAGPVVAMSDRECWGHLAGSTLGRLAVSVDDQPDVFPVNFVVQKHSIVIRTAEGTKLASAATNHRVAFEADDHDAAGGWSVVVKGHARVLSSIDDVATAERAQVLPWISTPKRRFIRITPTEIAGRTFRFGGEPEDSDGLE